MFILNQVQSVENLSDMKNLEFNHVLAEKPVEAPSMVEKQITASGRISSKSKESQQSKLFPEKSK